MAEIVFICTGNTCRSPIAEALFNVSARRRGIRLRATSAGLRTGSHLTRETSTVLRSRGVVLDERPSLQVTAGLLEVSSVVLCMEAGQVAILQRTYPQLGDKLFTLGDLVERLRRTGATGDLTTLIASARGETAVVGHEVTDPIGRGLQAYEEAASRISDLVESLLGRVRHDWCGSNR